MSDQPPLPAHRAMRPPPPPPPPPLSPPLPPPPPPPLESDWATPGPAARPRNTRLWLLVGMTALVIALGAAFAVYALHSDDDSGNTTDGNALVSDTSVEAPDVIATTEAYTPPAEDAETSSAAALRRTADADRPMVSSTLADRWVPQLSSKKVGLVAEGITWDNAATLREYTQLRTKYPDARLLWSGEWSTFDYRDFWVTIEGVAFTSPDAANNWCAVNGLDADHCFAKMVSTTHPVDGSTVTRN